MSKLKNIIIFLFIMGANLTVCPRLYSEMGWKEYGAGHFIVYYRKEIPVDYIKTVAQKAEEYYVSIAGNLGCKLSESWSFDNRAKIYIFKDREEYKQEATERPWASGSVNISKKIIKSYHSCEDFLERVLPHELGHIIFHDLIGARNDIPLWLDEGVAILQENAEIKNYSIMLRDFVKINRPVPIEKLHMITAKTLIVPELVYPQAASLVDFLLTEFKKEKFQQFCRFLSSGKPVSRALASAYGIQNLKELEQAWLEYLNTLEGKKTETPISIKAKE